MIETGPGAQPSWWQAMFLQLDESDGLVRPWKAHVRGRKHHPQGRDLGVRARITKTSEGMCRLKLRPGNLNLGNRLPRQV